MRVTCVLTSHAQPVLVHEAIASVRGQTTDDWQLVVVDSGAMLAAGEFLGYSHDPRVVVFGSGETPEMRGAVCLQGRAINEAWRLGLVRGDLVTYLSDDDVFSPGLFAAWQSVARGHPDWQAWYGWADRTELRPGGEVKVGELVADLPGGIGGVSLDGRADGMQACHRRECYAPWPEDAAAWSHADGVWMDELGKFCTIHPVPVVVGRHRHTPLSTFTRPGAPA